MDAEFMTQEDLEDLLTARHEPAISIYLPMERRGHEVRGNSIRLKNALARWHLSICPHAPRQVFPQARKASISVG